MKELKRRPFLLVILIYILAFILLLLDIRASWDSTLLTLWLNTILVVIPSLFMAIIAAQGFRRSGVWPVLWLGAGSVTFGLGILLTSLLRVVGSADAAGTDYTFLVMLASLLHFLAAVFLLARARSETAPNRAASAAGVYAIALIVVALITFISVRGVLPPLFFQDAESTFLRNVILGVGSALFFLAGLVALWHYLKTGKTFVYWYALALLLSTLLPAGNASMVTSGTPLHWALRAAQLLGGIYLLMTAITILREARAQRRPIEEVISEFNHQTSVNYELLVKGASDAIVAVDGPGRVLTWNPAAEHMFGYKRGEAIGMAFVDLTSSPAEVASYGRMAEEKREQADLTARPVTMELTARRKNGEGFPVELTVLSKGSVLARMTGATPTTTLVIRDITERKQAEAETRRLLTNLQSNEERLQAQAEDLIQSQREAREARDKYLDLYDYAPIGYLTIDRDGIILESNLTAARLLGVERVSLVRSSLSAFVASDQISVLASCVGEVLASNTHQTCEIAMLRGDGSQFHARLDSIAVPSAGDSRIVRMTISDITELKRAEENLKATTERYQTLFNSIDEGFSVIEMVFDNGGKAIDYRFLEVNPAFERLTGLHDVTGKLVRSLIPKHEEHWFNTYGRIALSGQPERFESTAQSSNRYYDVYAFRVGGPDSRKVAILFSDISERRKAAEELARTKEDLEVKVRERTAQLKRAIDEISETNAFNTGLLENSPVAIIVLNPDGSIRYANPQVEKTFGYTAREVSGLRPPFPWWPADRIQDYNRVVQFALRGASYKSDRSFVRKNGELFWTDTTLTPIMKDNRVAIVLTSSIDITEPKRLRDELELFNHRIILAQEAERNVIARELHEETVQMLATVKLEMDSLLQSLDGSRPENAEKLQCLLSNTSRAIDQIRRFSYSLRPAELENLGMETALEKLCDDLREDGTIEVALAVSGEIQMLAGDKGIVLFRIAQEALNNIRKHARARHVRVSLGYKENDVTLKVEDDGQGFDMEKEPQFALERGRLGLIGMRERAKLISATLTIESKPGKGTAITLCAPL